MHCWQPETMTMVVFSLSPYFSLSGTLFLIIIDRLQMKTRFIFVKVKNEMSLSQMKMMHCRLSTNDEASSLFGDDRFIFVDLFYQLMMTKNKTPMREKSRGRKTLSTMVVEKTLRENVDSSKFK